MGGPRLEVDSRELRRELRRIADEGLKRELIAANKELATEVIRRAEPNVPVRSGLLRSSVRGLGNQAGAVGKAGNAKVPYAAAIHWGRKRGGVIRARPFLTDAARTVESDVADRYMARIDALFNEIRKH